MRKRQVAWAALPAVALAWQVDRHWLAGPWSRIDFHIYYDAVDAMHATPLYDFRETGVRLGFTYPPLAAILLRPLTVLDELRAEQVWLVASALLSAAFVGLIVWGVHRGGHAGGSNERFGAGTAATAAVFMLASMPVSLTLRLGQINALIACLVALDAVLLTRGSRFAGVASGLAAAVKITPALLVPALLVMGRGRDAARATVTAVALTTAAAVVAPRDSWTYFTHTLFDTRRVGDGGEFNGSLRRLAEVLHETDALWLVLGAAIVVLLIAGVGVRRAAQRGDLVEAVTLTALASYLLSPITWGHHLYFCGPAVYLLWLRRDPLSRALALAGAVVMLDPFEGGEGPTYSLWRLAFMVAATVVLAATEPRAARVPRERREPDDSSPAVLSAPEAA